MGELNNIRQIGAAATMQSAMEFLSFTIGKEEYAIDIQKVQELRGYEAPTCIANAPDFLKGVLNLRGVIVPIVDMRIKFKLDAPTYDHFTVVIILNIRGRTIGMVVDSVSDVIALTPEQLKPAPNLGAALDADYIAGLGALDGRMLILVDIDRLMTGADMGVIRAAEAA